MQLEDLRTEAYDPAATKSGGRLVSPKLQDSGRDCDVWRFYAGYSFEFVQQYLRNTIKGTQSTILDPWNGSGTTTAAAHSLGIHSIGLDLNPVMGFVARARVASTQALKAFDALIASGVGITGRKVSEADGDPLMAWCTASTASQIRHLQTQLTQNTSRFLPRSTNSSRRAQLCDEVASLIQLSLFQTVRQLVAPFTTSNPTWIRIPKANDGGPKVSASAAKIASMFQQKAEALLDGLVRAGLDALPRNSVPALAQAASWNLPLPCASIDYIVSSPPYGTRIDYAMATAVECAVLGLRFDTEFDTLRHSLTGSTKLSKYGQLVPAKEWGSTCLEFLQIVKEHPSHGSRTYYFKSWAKYFNDIYLSLLEISRVLKTGGHCALIVQDSFYKETRAPIQEIFEEMSHSFGLPLIDRFDFPNPRNKASIHPRSKDWREKTIATESVLAFTKIN
ncbi:DNA methyltransferase [Burkholderia gladioli]|uniref:DNA methyltransferase n=1 Tax=Burkholderia gladioli TaxID=28095 RepID=UPI001641E329|nr:DNA methyltransferase [Burkholderia gladioli]